MLSFSQADLWLMVGNATRICTPLGLNHLRAASDEPEQPAHYKGYLIQGTDDQEELYERAMVFYIALMADRYSSASTGWATSLDEGTSPGPGHVITSEDADEVERGRGLHDADSFARSSTASAFARDRPSSASD
jgi:hypothetical protein